MAMSVLEVMWKPLLSAADAVSALPMQPLMVLDALYAFSGLWKHEGEVTLRTGTRSFWLYSYVHAMMVIFSGSFVGSILLGTEAQVLKSNVFLPLYSLIWFLVFFSPLDVVPKVYQHGALMPLRVVCSNACGVLRVRTIVDFVSQAQKTFPGSPFAPIIVGLLVGCASTLYYDLEHWTRSSRHTSQLSKPGFAMKSTLLIAVTYHAMSTWFSDYVSRDQTFALMQLLLASLYIPLEVFGSVDLFFPLKLLSPLFFSPTHAASEPVPVTAALGFSPIRPPQPAGQSPVPVSASETSAAEEDTKEHAVVGVRTPRRRSVKRESSNTEPSPGPLRRSRRVSTANQ